MNILAISGSLRKQSFNTSLLRSLQKLAPEGMEITIHDLSGLPVYDQDAESPFPAPAQALKDAIAKADGIIISTPEYNRSIPGGLKNAIDWASRPYGKNSFAKKPTLIAGVSVGKIGTAIAQSHLRQILAHLDAYVVGQPELFLGPAQEIFNEDGEIMDESTKDMLINALNVLKSRIA